MFRTIILALALFGSVPAWAEPARETDGHSVQEQLRDHFLDAARRGDTLMLDEFIQAGYDLDTADQRGYTALILAAYNGQMAAVEQLLAAGADACAKDKRGNTALLGAIFKGELRIARRLLLTECDPDQRNDAGQTPAMYAALFRRHELLEALEQRGADLSASDALGNSVESLSRGVIRTR